MKLKKYADLLRIFLKKNPIPQSLGTFTKRLPKAIVKIVTLVRSSIHPDGRAGILLDGFWSNFLFSTS
jgi:hypothetical protein